MVPPARYRALDYEEIAQTVERLHSRISERFPDSALLVQYFNDPVLLGAVDEIETLTTGMSEKIWQKIQLLDARRVAV